MGWKLFKFYFNKSSTLGEKVTGFRVAQFYDSRDFVQKIIALIVAWSNFNYLLQLKRKFFQILYSSLNHAIFWWKLLQPTAAFMYTAFSKIEFQKLEKPLLTCNKWGIMQLLHKSQVSHRVDIWGCWEHGSQHGLSVEGLGHWGDTPICGCNGRRWWPLQRVLHRSHCWSCRRRCHRWVATIRGGGGGVSVQTVAVVVVVVTVVVVIVVYTATIVVVVCCWQQRRRRLLLKSNLSYQLNF